MMVQVFCSGQASVFKASLESATRRVTFFFLETGEVPLPADVLAVFFRMAKSVSTSVLMIIPSLALC